MNKNFLYGLIGYPLTHSFSQRYFSEKFEKGCYSECSYMNFPLASISELGSLLSRQLDLCGFNVTIPYKEAIVEHIDEMDAISREMRCVNTVLVERCKDKIFLKGYNTDVYGFRRSFEEWFAALDKDLPDKALILGSGGASKAVAFALHELKITVNIVSRKEGNNIYKTYEQLDAGDISAHQLIVNTTPLGMYPDIEGYPAIPYKYLTEKHFLYDLIYNPSETVFMKKGQKNGVSVCNGLRMLQLQADKSWEIWKKFLGT